MLCEKCHRNALLLTQFDWVIFQAVTLQDIIPMRIRVLRSDLSEPVRGADERIGKGPRLRKETLAPTRAKEGSVVLGWWVGGLGNSHGFAPGGFDTARC